MKINNVKKVVYIVISSISVSSCAMMPQSDALANERLLLAAGFQKQMADTQEKLEQVQSLQQRTMISTQENGELTYRYVDAKFCNCQFVGSEQDYQRYQELELTPVNNERKIDPTKNWYWP